MKIIACLILVISTSLAYAVSEDPRRNDAIAFLNQIKAAVKDTDKNWLAEHVSYPLWFWDGENLETVYTKEAFLVSYDTIINRYVVLALWNAEGNELFHRTMSYSFGRGAVHFDERGLTEPTMKWTIVAINNHDINVPYTDKQWEACKARVRDVIHDEQPIR